MKKLFAFLIYVIGTFILLEFVLRICFPIPEYNNFNRINYQILDRVDDQNGYLRNIEMVWKSTLDTNHNFVHQLNTYGYRDPLEWKSKKDKNKKRFFFVGDSFVEGMMSTADQTIPATFHTMAESDGKSIEVFNCGMMGIGLNEYIKFIKDAVPIYQPDELILVLYSNDLPFNREYIPQERMIPQENPWFESRLLKVIKQIRKEDPIPFAFNPEKRPFYKAVPDIGNPWTTLEASLKHEVTPEIADAMKKGDFNYFRTNWILEEERFLKSPINIYNRLQFIRDYLRQYNTDLSIFYVPSRSQVSNYYYQFEKQACQTKCPESIDLTGVNYQQHAAVIAENCRQLGVRFKDLTQLIKEKESIGHHLYWNYDDHMKGRGYELLGKSIYDFWKTKR